MPEPLPLGLVRHQHLTMPRRKRWNVSAQDLHPPYLGQGQRDQYPVVLNSRRKKYSSDSTKKTAAEELPANWRDAAHG